MSRQSVSQDKYLYRRFECRLKVTKKHQLVRLSVFHFCTSSFIMSRSHSYSSSNYSRGSRQQPTPNLAVTEASFQGLQLSDTSLSPSYNTSDRYSSRGTYAQSSLSSNYLNPGYDSTSFASTSPSGSYLGSQRGVSPLGGLEQDPGSFFDTEPSSYNRADMR